MPARKGAAGVPTTPTRGTRHRTLRRLLHFFQELYGHHRLFTDTESKAQAHKVQPARGHTVGQWQPDRKVKAAQAHGAVGGEEGTAWEGRQESGAQTQGAGDRRGRAGRRGHTWAHARLLGVPEPLETPTPGQQESSDQHRVLGRALVLSPPAASPTRAVPTLTETRTLCCTFVSNVNTEMEIRRYLPALEKKAGPQPDAAAVTAGEGAACASLWLR